jgi:hypothetical protein
LRERPRFDPRRQAGESDDLTSPDRNEISEDTGPSQIPDTENDLSRFNVFFRIERVEGTSDHLSDDVVG